MSTATTEPLSQPASDPLQELVWDHYSILLGIKRRYYVIKALQEELDRSTRGRPFRMRNDIVWNMALDVRDKLIIDLNSWVLGMRECGKGGFFDTLRQYCAEMPRTRRPYGDDRFEDLRRMHDKHHAETFGRLFPNCASQTPTKHDVESLREAFRLRSAELRDDRNRNRAHIYEGNNLAKLGQIKMLSVPELGDLFTYYEQVLEDVSIVTRGHSLGGDDMNWASSTESAKDLVDLLVFGNIDAIKRLTANRSRDNVYVRLHQLHDSGAQTGDRDIEFFNDHQFWPHYGTDLD